MTFPLGSADESASKPFWCPFCRSHDVRVVEVTADFRTVSVECRRCGKVSVLAYPPIDK
jgi:transcription elongation factor Elf1